MSKTSKIKNTVIQVNVHTRDELKTLGKKGDSYNTIISEMLGVFKNEYIDELVRRKWFDSQAQAIQFFIKYFQSHRDSNTVLPTMAELEKKWK